VVRLGQRFWLVHASDAADVETNIDYVKRQCELTQTQKEALIQVRIGQVQFRRDQIHSWGACAVTGCAVQAVLEACHINPWGAASDLERLDADNGLYLTANLHRLFDAGLITFDDQGKMLVSHRLSKEDRDAKSRRGIDQNTDRSTADVFEIPS
jgi:predicted restriction endonuclease